MKARLPKGMGGGPTDMNGMIRQAQKMQEEMAALQEELDAKEYEVQAGGGAVTVKINGKNEITAIEIDPEIVDPDDIETLQDILIAGVNEAIKKVSETNSNEMSKITGSLSMPGLF
ncbi:MAG: YbaB/EbfC family nucleoid-associated protein [Ruminococcaceae bacterium]|nr:YbaB/EbfC family nucleoid-associated protein [Oscillospiraceae bacterium]